MARHFGLWAPEQSCSGIFTYVRHSDDSRYWRHCIDCIYIVPPVTIWVCSHEIPCPDLTEPAWSDTLGDALPVDEILFHRFDKGWCCQLFMVFDVRPNEWSDDSWGPTKRESLLLAAYQLVQREAPK